MPEDNTKNVGAEGSSARACGDAVKLDSRSSYPCDWRLQFTDRKLESEFWRARMGALMDLDVVTYTGGALFILEPCRRRGPGRGRLAEGSRRAGSRFRPRVSRRRDAALRRAGGGPDFAQARVVREVPDGASRALPVASGVPLHGNEHGGERRRVPAFLCRPARGQGADEHVTWRDVIHAGHAPSAICLASRH